MDADLNESKSLPPSRPDSQLTMMLWCIAKNRLYSVAEDILSEQFSTFPTSQEKLVQLDKSLREAYRAVPAVLAARTMSESLSDPPDVIMMRAKIETLYQKCLCILHRNNTRSTASAVKWSRKICAESAMALLQQMTTIFEACEPGGQMFEEVSASCTPSDILESFLAEWLQTRYPQALRYPVLTTPASAGW